MTSRRQLEANRANAKRSTGPKTPERVAAGKGVDADGRHHQPSGRVPKTEPPIERRVAVSADFLLPIHIETGAEVT
jgi:hypothetical protein